MVFERGTETQKMGRPRAVKALEETAPKRPMINDGSIQSNPIFRGGIDAAAPHAAPQGTKVLRMFSRQHGLGFTITVLLLQIGAYGGAAVVPNEACCAEPDLIA